MGTFKRQALILVGGVIFGFNLVLWLEPVRSAEAVANQNLISELSLFQALILGIVQGFTEFLPISSTAHLKAIPMALGWGDPGVAYTAVIQLGSIAAILWYFWEDLRNITLGMLRAIRQSDYQSQEFRLAIGIGIGTLPIVVFGLIIKLFFKDVYDAAFRSMITLAIASIVMALLLGLSEKICSHKRKFDNIKWQDGLFMGLAQALAIIPGVSRAGSTLTSGLFVNLERATAARFSFLLGIPAITLAGIVELKDAWQQGIAGGGLLPMIVGIISSAVFSYLAIAWLLNFLQKQDTWIFVWYRLLFGIIILIAVGIGAI